MQSDSLALTPPAGSVPIAALRFVTPTRNRVELATLFSVQHVCRSIGIGKLLQRIAPRIENGKLPEAFHLKSLNAEGLRVAKEFRKRSQAEL